MERLYRNFVINKDLPIMRRKQTLTQEIFRHSATRDRRELEKWHSIKNYLFETLDTLLILVIDCFLL